MKDKFLYTKAVAMLLLIMATAFLFSCTKKVGNLPPIVPPPMQQLPAVVSFSTHIIPIFNASCNSSTCHSATLHAANLDLSPASAYNNLIARHEVYTANPSGSNIMIEISNGQMPQPPAPSLSSYDQQLILKWIQQGAMNN